MKKNCTAINHTEIICYAIAHVQAVIRDKVSYLDGIPECEKMLEAFLAEYTPKLEALKQLYFYETGTEYGE